MDRFRLQVEYNGDHYVHLQNDLLDGLKVYKEYAIGELACAFTRLDLFPVKDIILQTDGIHEKLDIDEREDAFDHYYDVRDRIVESIWEQYPPLYAGLLSYEIAKAADGYLDVPKEYKEERDDWAGFRLWEDQPGIQSILEGSGYTEYGAETIGQFLLTCLAIAYERFHFSISDFRSYVRCQENPTTFDDNFSLQERFKGRGSQSIQFEVLFYNDRLNSVYTIESFSSLMMFEYLHMAERSVKVKKCRNCGNYFIPGKRSDAIYCSFPSPSNPEKTCKEVGAQIAWSNKEKSDIVTREYRKTYMWLKNIIKRHPENKDAIFSLTILTEGIKDWRRALEAGDVGTDAFLKWLDSFRR